VLSRNFDSPSLVSSSPLLLAIPVSSPRASFALIAGSRKTLLLPLCSHWALYWAATLGWPPLGLTFESFDAFVSAIPQVVRPVVMFLRAWTKNLEHTLN